MRTSRIRGFAHRELRGLLDGLGGRRDVLILDHVERVAALVAARTDDAETIAAVYVYALLRYGDWDRQRVAEAGFAPRLIAIGDAARLHPIAYHRFPASVVARAELISVCLSEVHGHTPPTPERKAEERARSDRARLAGADDATVRRLIADLDASDEETWWYAVKALVSIRSAEAVEPLLATWERLYRSDPARTEYQRAGLRRGVRLSMTEAHLALAHRLAEHEDAGLREVATNFLRSVDDPQARSAVIRQELESLRPVLGLTAADPTPTQPEDVIGPLVAILTENPGKQRVITAMALLGDRSCLPALTKSLGWWVAGSVHNRAEEAIRAIGGTEALGRAVLDVLADPKANAKRAAHLAGRLRLTEAVPDLIAIVRDGREGDLAAATTLAAFGATQAAPVIARALGRVDPKYWSARASLIGSLLRLDPEPAVDELIAAAGNRLTRDIAMNALARCSDPRATVLVATVLFHGVIRMELVRPLAERGDPGVVGALVHVVNTTRDRKIRQVATQGIRKAAQVDQKAVDAQLELLNYSAPSQTALAWLEGHRRPFREKYPLHELMQTSKNLNEQVRAQTVKSLALIGTPGAFEIIRSLRNDPSRHVRACVAGALQANEY